MPPLRLAIAAGGAAVLAVALFAVGAALREEGPASGVREVDPQSIGFADLNLDAQGVLDTDRDGLVDALENTLYGSDPGKWNSSGTPLPDGWLALHGFSPLDAGVAQRPAVRPPVADLPSAYGNRWPDRFTPTLLDVYGHGRPEDWDEATQGAFASGLDPSAWDSNGDGLPDGWLLHYGLDPLDEGLAEQHLSEPPGLTVREAFERGTDPRSADGDADGLDDLTEVAGPANPRAPDGPLRFPSTDPSRYDSSGSGVCDGWMAANGLDPTSATAAYQDPDRDGATTREEFLWSRDRFGLAACDGQGLDPRSTYSGGARIPDGWLLRFGLDPFQTGVAEAVTQASQTDPGPPSEGAAMALTVMDEYGFGRPSDWDEARQGPWWGGTDPGNNDTDGDGLGDAWEMAGYRLTVATEANQPTTYAAKLDPTRGDSDGDGLADRDEVARGTDGSRQDTDFDGLSDGFEIGLALDLNPRLADSTADPVRFPSDHKGDRLRDGERYGQLVNRSRTYASDLEYEYAGPPPASVRRVTDLPFVVARLGASPAPSQVAALFGPAGDGDGDGIPNVLDADMDNDTLPNGQERRPVFSGPGFIKVLPSPSDLLNPDTDGDALRDAWEVEYGTLDTATQGSNLDPAQWDSDRDGLADGLEDPDGDSIEWHDLQGSPPIPRSGTYTFSNSKEQDFGTDPNHRDTDDDALLDGWEVFWGAVQVPAGASHLPNVKVADPVNEPASLLFTATYHRFVVDSSANHLLQDANDPTTPAESDNGRSDVAKDGTVLRNVTGTVRFRFHDAQRLETNPHLLDTDGDGGPDWWEDLYGRALPKLRDSLPSTDRTAELAGCVAASGLAPTAVDGAQDVDKDSLGNAKEFLAGSDPLCQDTDSGGVADGEEASLGLHPDLPRDDISQSDPTVDADKDGLPDKVELAGKSYPDLGSRPVRTNRTNPDSDGDGLLDGPDVPTSGCWAIEDPLARSFLDLGIAYRKSGACYTFLGERPTDASRTADPRDGDDCRCSIPTGWLAAYDRPVSPSSSQYFAHFSLGMPSWWNAAVHGPWWGGANPLDASQDVGVLRGMDDLDADGLQDRDEAGSPAEDPFPAANSLNALRSFTAPANGHLAPRLAAQALVNPAPYTTTRPTVAHPTDPAADTRAATCLGDVRLAGSAGPVPLPKGTPTTLEGRLTRCTGGAAVQGIAVQALLANVAGKPRNLFGAGFTDADGRFSFPVVLDGSPHGVVVPEGAQSPFRGNASGAVEWTPDAAAAKAGSGNLVVRSYAVGPLASAGGLRRAEVSIPVQVTATARLLLEAPAQVLTGEAVPIRLQLVDSGGAPIEGVPVDLTWNSQHMLVMPVDGVYTGDLPPVPAADAGQVVLSARAEPSGSPAITAERSLTALAPGVVELAPLAGADAGRTLSVTGQVRRVAGVGSQVPLPGVAVFVNLTRGGETLETAQAMSDVAGRFVAQLELNGSLPSGLYEVAANVPATGKSTAAQTETAVAVRGLTAFQSVSTGSLGAADRSVVSARLVDALGVPVADATVDIVVGPVKAQARSAANGTLSVPIDAPSRPGTVLQTLTFAGDARHAPATHRAERAVLAPTRLVLAGGELARGAEASVPVQLVTRAGDAVTGVAVGVQWGTEPPQFPTTDAAGFVSLVRPGVAGDVLGPVMVQAWFAGSPGGGLGNSSASAVWTVRALATLDLPGSPVDAGGSAPFARLLDAGTGEPLAGRNVTVRVRGGPMAATLTDAAGRFPLLAPVPRDADPAIVHVEATFAGDDEYPAVQRAVDLNIRSPTTLEPRVPAKVVAGQPIVLTVDALDLRGLPATGGLLQASTPRGVVGTATVQDGPVHITIELPPDSPAGPTTLLFRYEGSDSHGPSEAGAESTVVARAVLATHAKAVRAGSLAHLTVQLTVAGQPVAGEPVTVQFAGMPEGIVGLTDANGTATFSVQQPGTALTFLARYDGASLASPAAAGGRLVAVGPATVLAEHASFVPWIVAAVALALVAATVLASRLRRHPLDPAFVRARRLVTARGEPERQIMLAYAALEDAAIAVEALAAPAATPRTLQEALKPFLLGAGHAPLERLMGLFEDARYGREALGEEHRRLAQAALLAIHRALARTPPAERSPVGVAA